MGRSEATSCAVCATRRWRRRMPLRVGRAMATVRAMPTMFEVRVVLFSMQRGTKHRRARWASASRRDQRDTRLMTTATSSLFADGSAAVRANSKCNWLQMKGRCFRSPRHR